MTTFLQTLQSSLSLSDSEIKIFTEDKMTELIHFIELDKNDLKEMGFARGPANAILAHIKSLIPEKAQVIKIESESDDNKFKKACEEFNKDKTITKELKEFSNRFVLINNRISFIETKAMLAFKGNPGDIWKGNPIVSLSDLDDSEIWMNPRNRTDLQDGFDPNTGIEWILLGQDKMCLVAFAEEWGLLLNKDDETVFDIFDKNSKLYDLAITKLKASGKKLSNYIGHVKRSANDSRSNTQHDNSGSMDSKSSQPKNKNKALMDLLLNSFGVDEMKRFLRYTVGDGICQSVNFLSSPASVTFDVVQYLDRNGHTNSTSFWDALLSERPRRRLDIVNVSTLYGIMI